MSASFFLNFCFKINFCNFSITDIVSTDLSRPILVFIERIKILDLALNYVHHILRYFFIDFCGTDLNGADISFATSS